MPPKNTIKIVINNHFEASNLAINPKFKAIATISKAIITGLEQENSIINKMAKTKIFCTH